MGAAGLVLFVLIVLRLKDSLADKKEWSRLLALQPSHPALYDPDMVAHLPEPVQRYFNFVLSPGVPLLTVAEVNMGGQFSLGSRENPRYQQMRAWQILAAPEGFVWKLHLPGIVSISGSDSARWTRFRLLGLLPVARMGGNQDHTRAAYGRYVAEALFWSPAALLPGSGIQWDEVDSNRVRVTVTYKGLSQAVDIWLDQDGRPVEVCFMRWSDANPDKVYRLQPFGGKVSDFREVQGFRLPFYVEVGNMYGTDDFFCFFKAQVLDIHFPAPD